MLQNFLLFIDLCVCVQSGFAQIISDVSNPRQFNFNLKDSQGWSAELQRINFTKSQVGADHEFGLMQFQSADGSLQINSSAPPCYYKLYSKL